ncbi:hypothetical protein [Argonema antarcticum]|uniref:hypothetical protein n=1 Tax=Argonema antarcticum TaxID=2942763 RepID=UPI002011303C|nr:hypothetical protein [Argonema antarcticum]MCL1469442.1 hypothetical protein [Argonema antarcticum A004/B2]
MKTSRFKSVLALLVTAVILLSDVGAAFARPRIRLNRSPRNPIPRTGIIGTRLRGFLPTPRQHGQNRKRKHNIPARDVLQAVREGRIVRQHHQRGRNGRMRVRYEGRNATVVTQNGRIVTTFWNNPLNRSRQRSAAEGRRIPFPNRNR